MRKKTLLILLLLAWVCLSSCAVTPVTLRDYKPANPEEAAIISAIIAFEESLNKVDHKKIIEYPGR